ncbi:MAG TPA: hypothetical protein VJQ47_17395 [Steroidobacteraceae bacterium]|nr:hypothetical protein [Steroidobacteraceae bacterium]
MPLSRKVSLCSTFAAQCLIGGFAATTQAQADIPAYFFNEWSVAANCTEANAVVATEVAPGLLFKITRDSVTSDGSYAFTAESTPTQQWAPDWNGVKLAYRAGTPLTTLPADFECVPGQDPSTSPFLANSGYAQSGEPYYEQEHWYGLANIQGTLEHVLVFPRNVSGAASAIIVLASVNTPDTVQLDDDGVIHGRTR